MKLNDMQTLTGSFSLTRTNTRSCRGPETAVSTFWSRQFAAFPVGRQRGRWLLLLPPPPPPPVQLPQRPLVCVGTVVVSN